MRKKIGILTMHSVVHHGSVLQAYATQELIRQLGHDAELIDYKYPNDWHYANGYPHLKGKITWKTKIASTLGLRPQYRRAHKIRKFMRRYYNLSNHYLSPESLLSNPPHYDIYIVGSDQVWNPRFMQGDTIFLLAFTPETSKRISLSSSFACKILPDEKKDSYRKELSKFHSISVREKQGTEIIRDLLGKEVKVTLDPTLLLDSTFWNFHAKVPKGGDKFLFLYMLDYAYNPTPYIYEVVKYMQSKFRYKVYSYTNIPQEFNIQYTDVSDAGIEQFLGYIKYSSLVVTSSFHGTAFSVNFGTPLLAIVPQVREDDRLASLLEMLDLSHCIVPYGTPFYSLNPTYDIDKEQRLLAYYRNDSIEYLKNALSD